MKQLIIFLAAFLSINLQAQNCDNGFYPFKAGAHWEMTNYSASNKVEGKSSSVVNSITKTTDGFKANVTAKGEDAKGKESFSSNYDIECARNIIKMNMKNLISQEQLSAYKDMQIDFTTDNLETPNSLKIGDSLKSSSITMTVKSNDMVISTMTIEIYNRIVLAKEEITVPAGTYMCYKIGYKTRVTNSIAGMPMKTDLENTEWLSPGAGVVKQESYRKGKLNNTTMLTKFSL
jgi:hypothetical protein